LDYFLGKIYRIRRIVWFTIAGTLVWPVALLMAWSYPDERKYWLGVFGVSAVLTVIGLVCLGVKGMLG